MLSVIVVSFNSPSILRRCLAALWPQIRPDEAAVLVVGRWPDDCPPAELARQFPQVEWLPAPAQATIPQMRTLGIKASRGDLVALLEDDCLVTATWCQDVIAAHQNPNPAIGGGIEPGAYGKGLDWGVYFCEYGRFLPPFSGVVPTLPGNHVSYKRQALEKALNDDGFYEVFVHGQWQQSGEALLADDKLVVRNINSWTGWHVTQMPYHHGRAFSGMRMSKQPIWRRFLFAGLTAGLPALQTLRLLRIILSRQRYRAEFFKAMPWIILFYASWAAGEWVGALFGPGQSADQWR